VAHCDLGNSTTENRVSGRLEMRVRDAKK